MTTNNILDMNYRVQVTIDGVILNNAREIESVGVVIQELLGAVQWTDDGILCGRVAVEGVDLEVVHQTLESSKVDVRIGIARTDDLASVALLWSDRSGITYIAPEDEDVYLAGIPVGEIRGVSQATAIRLCKFQIFTAYDIKHSNQQFLETNLGSDISAIYNAYNPHDVMVESSWYKQITVGKTLSNISEFVVGSAGRSLKGRQSETKLITGNKVPAVLDLFNYQSAVINTL